MISSLRLRSDFDSLRGAGVTVRSGHVRIRFYQPPGATERKVAYALSSKHGKAVRRNRLRRQLKEIMSEIAVNNRELLPFGNYLIWLKPYATLPSGTLPSGTSPSALPSEPGTQRYYSLKDDVERALGNLSSKVCSTNFISDFSSPGAR